MNGKKVNSINPVARLSTSLAYLGSSAPSTLRSMGPIDRPQPIADRLSTISDADLIKYLQSTCHFVKNENLLESLPDNGLKIRTNLANAEKEAQKRSLQVTGRAKGWTADEVWKDAASIPLHSHTTKNVSSERILHTEVSPGKKMVNKAADKEPDLEHALQSLSLRCHLTAKAGILQKDTPALSLQAKKAKSLTLNESLALEKHHQEWKEGILEQHAKEEVKQSILVGPSSLVNQEVLDYRKYQFLRYQEDDSLDDSDDEDIIKEEDSAEENDMAEKEED